MIAIYIRTSTEDQNPENQLKDIYNMGVSNGVQVYEDKQSAWKDDKERDSFDLNSTSPFFVLLSP